MLNENLLRLNGIHQDRFSDTNETDTTIDYADSQASSGQADVVVGNGGNFTAGQSVILYDGATTYESAIIDSIATNTLTMTANLTNTYPEGSRIGYYHGVIDTDGQVYYKPPCGDLGDGSDGSFTSSGSETWSAEKNYTSITIQSGHTISIDGNFDIKCQGTVTIDSGGTLSAKGYGYAGGLLEVGGYDGYQGTSYDGTPTTSHDANYGGGGGGAGGGDNDLAGGGGGGAYGSGGSRGNGDSDYEGLGGSSYNDAELNDTFTIAYLKGSGGGAGGNAYSGGHGGGGVGGDGGGIIRLNCKKLVVSGEIDCDGDDGADATQQGTNEWTTGGGGGAGGTIFIQCNQLVTAGSSLIHADGGSGGNGWSGTSANPSFSGGGGGNGRIRIEAGKVTGTTSPTYVSGYGTNGNYGRYGWYHTELINADNETITANCIIKNTVAHDYDMTSTSGASTVTVSSGDGDNFDSGDTVILFEGSLVEIATVDSESGGVITMDSTLENSYTTAGNVIRVDFTPQISMNNSDENQNFQDMTIREVYNVDTGIWKFVFNKTVKALATGSGGSEVQGRVLIASPSNDPYSSIEISEIDWSYY